MTDPNIIIEAITPETAEQYLAKNTHNRNMRQRVVNAYATDMETGNWVWNGEAIKFAGDGTLIDGQHRLAAIIQSGVTVKMMVIRDLPKSTQHTMDTGAKRNFSDVLRLRGEDNYVPLSTATRSALLWSRGERVFVDRRGSMTNSQLLDYLDANPWLRDAAPRIQRTQRGSGLPTAVGGALYYAFSQIDPEDCDYFFDRLASDEDHRTGEPIYMLRRHIANLKDQRRLHTNALSVGAITIKAWNAWREGREVGVLRFSPGGATPETFPEPR